MTTKVTVFANHGWPVEVTLVDPRTGQPSGPFRVEAGSQSDFHAHSGADVRIHEVQPGEDVGRSLSDAAPHAGLPVSGYRPQSEANVARVNAHKQDEERLLRKLDALKDDPAIDQRWLAVGRTALEQAFMAINRAIFRRALKRALMAINRAISRPGRLELPE